MKVEFHPLAAKELGDATVFYEGKARGLGDDFLNEVDHLLGVLQTHPDLGRRASGPVRTIPTRRFPYTLIYRTLGDRLFVLAVAHQRRRPTYWSGRERTT